MKNLLTLSLLALCLCVSAKEICPKVILALQEWKGGSGKLALPAAGSIVIAPADEDALKSVATVLVQDLKDLLGRVQGEVVLPGQKEELSLNGTDSVATSLPEIGYPYAVEFEMNPDQEQNISGILFKGPHSTVYANWENKGNLAFSRDGYTFVNEDV